MIIGVNMQAATRTVFVFDVASSIVLGSRVVPVISPTLAVSSGGSRFLSGPFLFDTATLAVLAQQNATNSPYVFPATANFNLQTTQGGAVFTPDGASLPPTARPCFPGAHIKGSALPVTLKIGGVSSSTTGTNVPQVWWINCTGTQFPPGALFRR